MRVQARQEYETKYTAQRNYAQLMSIYELVLNLNTAKEIVVSAQV
jgi:hypothetical protein